MNSRNQSLFVHGFKSMILTIFGGWLNQYLYLFIMSGMPLCNNKFASLQAKCSPGEAHTRIDLKLDTSTLYGQ